MDTPICDFVRNYAKSETVRLHMPGHKGKYFLGVERLDITEIPGADSLYEADGIIRQSEENASGLFGCPTFYSTEGSSQCIRAMLYLALLWAKERGKPPVIAAGRNAHKTFLTGAALLDLEVRWLYPKEVGSYLSCCLTAEDVDFFIFHQANARIIDLAVRKYRIPPEKYYKNIADYGNTSAASIPLVLSELQEQGKVTPGSRVLVVGFGGGLTWGGMLVEFA